MSWWAIAAQAVGSALSSRGSRKENDRNSRSEREFLERQARRDAANRRAELEAARRWQLEDRRYNEEAIGGYRRFSRQDYGSPEYTNTTPSPIAVPPEETQQQQSNNTRRRGSGLLGG